MDNLLMKIAELTLEVEKLDTSREKSLILTKLDEARHWARDLRDRKFKEISVGTDTDAQ